MDVILDSNILIADPWLRSQRARALLDFLRKTGGRLCLLDPVRVEARAHLERTVRLKLTAAVAALRDAERSGVEGTPAVDTEHLVAATIRRWDASLDAVTRDVIVTVPYDPAVLQEAFRRAALRLAPCSASGSEMRDAVIWLTALAHAGRDPRTPSVAFISENTKDFAAAGGVTLRPELAHDVARSAPRLRYYSSLDRFLAEHSTPIEHVTLDWIRARWRTFSVVDFLEAELALRADELLRPASIDYRDDFRPAGRPFLHSADVELESFLVWTYENGGVKLDLSCTAALDAEVECERLARLSVRGWPSIDLDRPGPRSKVLACRGEVSLRVIAEVADDDVLVVGIEDVRPT